MASGFGKYFSTDAYLEVDVGELRDTVNLMRGLLSHKQFVYLMKRTFNEVGKRGKTIISKPVVEDYEVKKSWVQSQIEPVRITMGDFGADVNCVIPLKGHKGTIGGRFSATGGRNGRAIRARVVRKKRTVLPAVMKNQGGNPPFIGGGRLNGVAFTRRTKERYPIVRVVGLGVPQMPLNQSAAKVQNDLLDLAMKRLAHNFNYMFSKG